jgi:hypothetical protein
MKKAAQWIFVVVGGTIAILGLVGALAPAKYDRDEEDLRWKIQQCWGQQELKSNVGERARVIAELCEDLDAQYFKKYQKKARRD